MLTVLYVTHEHDIMLGSTHSLLNMIHSVRTQVNPIVLLPYEGTVSSILRQKGIKYIVARFPLVITDKHGLKYCVAFVPRKIRDLILRHKAILQIERQLKGVDIDIIHTNSSVIDFGDILAQRYHVPHIWHLREFIDLYFGFKPFGGWKKFYKRLNRSDATISISNAIHNHYHKAEYAGPAHAHVLYDAVRRTDDCRFESAKEPYFMMCGAITKSKGVEMALEAFRIFSDHDKSYKLLLIGNVTPEYKTVLSNIISRSGLDKKVEFIGHTLDIDSYYATASGLLMCSRNEGLGRVTIEAMFNGCPVIGYSDGATKEIINDGITGYLFDTPEECASQMKKLADTAEVRRLALNSHKRAKDMFSEEALSKRLIDIYHNVLNHNQAKR